MSERRSGDLNFKPETVWTGDNLRIMRGINSDCIDLIYLDPPFNSNRHYEAPIGSKAAGAAFKDAWTLDDVDVHEHGELAERNQGAYTVIQAAREMHGKSMQSYLIFMGVRLLEMHRILKPTGSIYLHCDPTASHYLKLLMDAIFGRPNYRNEIIWQRFGSHNDAKRYGRVTDTLLFYCGRGAAWNPVHVPLSQDDIDRRYRLEDNRGKYTTSPLHARTLAGGGYEYTWKGIKDVWKFPRDRLNELEASGRIHWPAKQGGMPRRKVYLAENPGKPLSNLWTDISIATGKERTDYPTQKPLALLERIIAASSNSGDMVLDPFCGCATALVAADRMNRQWAGIDLSSLAIKLVDERIAQDRGSGLWGGANALDTPPHRTDLGDLPSYRTHRHKLYGEQEGICAGCDTHFPFKVMEVDHVLPKSRGGTDNPDNLQLLCSHCNRSKGGRTMPEWRATQA